MNGFAAYAASGVKRRGLCYIAYLFLFRLFPITLAPPKVLPEILGKDRRAKESKQSAFALTIYGRRHLASSVHSVKTWLPKASSRMQLGFGRLRL